MLRLTSDVFNLDGLSVVDLATVVGAVPLLDELLSTPDVYRFRRHDSVVVVHDITYLTPLTTSDSTPTSGRRSTTKKTAVVPADAPPSSAGKKLSADQPTSIVVGGGHPRTSKSCLDLIVEMEDEIVAARILDLSPFRQLAQNYWKTYQWLYGTLMLVHIVYMIVYTIYVLPDSATFADTYNSSTGTRSCMSLPTSDLFGLFLIWPCLVLAFLAYYTSVLFRYTITFTMFLLSPPLKR